MRQYERLVLVTALRLLGNLADAQDASQDVFLKLYRNLGKVQAAENFPGWLYRVTVNVCHDLRRQASGTAPVEDAAERGVRGCRSAADDDGGGAAAGARVEFADVAGEGARGAGAARSGRAGTDEVARVLGSSEATVRSQISKARVKVKEFVERYFRGRS